MKKAPTLYIVVPCYNEAAVLPETAKRLGAKLDALFDAGRISPKSRVIFVNDGSRDETWAMLRELHTAEPRFCALSLSRNRGHQNALLAGLFCAAEQGADAIVSMDADLQDDIEAVDRMLHAYAEGYEIVYGVRAARKTDSAFKRTSARMFYKLMHIFGAEIVYDHADYRLMSRRAVEALKEYREVNLFLRGIVPLLGFRTTTVEYDRGERFAGESKYPLKKMLGFALDGVTSFSVKPIRLILLLGALIFAVSIAALIYALAAKAMGRTVSGWTSLMASIWMLGGIQLLSLGMIGEYIGKIYAETKARPRYIVEEFLHSAPAQEANPPARE